MATLEVDLLLAEARWLRRLAHSLVRDPTEAADVEQETWAAALAGRPDPGRPLRPWLRTVLVNVVRMRGRGRGRRRPREEEFEAAREAPPTPAMLLERAEQERRLAARVVALDEPYRTTVLRRYQEGMSAEQIAALEGVPAGTVRWRLKTALDRLRREMDESPRWRSVLLAPLVPHARNILVAKKAFAILVILALLLVAGVEIARRSGRAAPGSGHASSSGRSALRMTAASPAPIELVRRAAQPGLPDRRIAGTVSFDGTPVAGARVHLTLAGGGPRIVEASTGADGSFDLGVWPAALYAVTATTSDKASRPLPADARDPGRGVEALEIILTACERLSGTVQDGSGGVVARARVSRADGGWPATETGEDGRFDLCLPWGRAEVSFMAESYGGVVIELDMSGPRRRDVVLIPDAVIEGTAVRAEDGVPIPGALVEVVPNQWSPERGAIARAVADAAGRFSVGGVSPGRNRLNASGDDRITASPIEVVAEAGRTLEGVEVPLHAAFTLEGQLVAQGRPVAGARVRLAIAGMLQAKEPQAVSQADGRFTIERVRPGNLTFVVDGYQVLSPLDLRMAAGAREVRVEVRAKEGIRGRVLRGADPVAGAEVSCAAEVTGSDGRYACPDLALGPHRLFARDGTSWGPRPEGLLVELRRGETREIDLELAYAAAICGSVVDQRGDPVAGVDVEVILEGGDDEGSGQTDTDGRFCAVRLRGSGDYRPVVFMPGGRLHRFEPARPFPTVAVAGPLTRADGVRLTVRRDALAISGRVVDPSGAPVADARVGAWPPGGADRPAPFFSHLVVPSATTDPDGRFRIGDLQRTDYALLVRGRDGSETVARRVAAGTSGVAVVLDPAGRIEGRLIGFATPPQIIAIVTDYQRSPLDAQVSGDRFHINATPPGRYVLTAVNGREMASATVVVRPGETGTVTLAARGRGIIDGRVIVRGTGAPVAGARCSAIPRAGSDRGNFYSTPDGGVVSDEEGRFTLDPAPTGEIAIHCSGTAATTGGLRVAALQPGERAPAQLEVVARGEHEGTIAALLSPIDLRFIAVTPGGPADRAGIALGDQVVAGDGEAVVGLGPDAVLTLIGDRPAGETARVAIQRAGQQRTLAVTVEASGARD